MSERLTAERISEIVRDACALADRDQTTKFSSESTAESVERGVKQLRAELDAVRAERDAKAAECERLKDLREAFLQDKTIRDLRTARDELAAGLERVLQAHRHDYDCTCTISGANCNCWRKDAAALHARHASGQPATEAGQPARREPTCVRCGGGGSIDADFHCSTCYREMEARAATWDPQHEKRESALAAHRATQPAPGDETGRG